MFNLPFAFAFSAGFVALASPCGVAMLPAYIGYYIGSREEGYEERPIALRLGQAMLVGGTAALAFLLLFGTFGVVWSAVGTVLRDVIPYIAIIVGVALVLLGAYMIVFMLVNKRSIALIPTIGVNWGTGSRGLTSVFLFGLAYALATLSCTFPIFLAILAQGQVIGGYAAFIMFLIYGAGMGVGLIGLTLGAAVFKDLIRVVIRQAMPIVEWASPVMLIGAGAYITYYWWVNWFAFNADF